MHDVKLELDKKTYLCTRFNDLSVPKMLKNRDHKSNSQRVDIQSGVNIVFQSAPDSNRLFELEVKPQNAAASGVRSDIWEPSDPTVRRSHLALLRHLTEVCESEIKKPPVRWQKCPTGITILVLMVSCKFCPK